MLFFCVSQSEDAQISKLAHSLKTVCERIKNIPDKLPLEYFSSANFIGLFVSDSMAAILKQITTDFAEEVKKIGKWDHGCNTIAIYGYCAVRCIIEQNVAIHTYQYNSTLFYSAS